MYCVTCSTNVGSSKSDVTQHSKTMQHTRKMQQKIAGSLRGVQLLQCITEYKGVVRSQAGGEEPVRFAEVPEQVQDTFNLSDWWKSNCATLPGFAYVLRAVLTNSPNSCPPERLFSLFNATYDDDQKRSHADYIELSMQSQFNKRDLR